MIWLAPALAYAACWLSLVWLLRRSQLPMDHPNARSLHTSPTPRIGGLGMMAGLLVGTIWLAKGALLPVILGAVALAGISLLDDVRNLPILIRFVAHFIAAAACLLLVGLDNWALPVSMLAVVWMTNLYNFMDGADGLAGGMTLIGFGALALAALLGGASTLAALCAAIAAAAAAFLHFNFPPAKLFMGDAGSIPLGYLAGTLAILGIVQDIWPWWFPPLVFSPFIVDASVTLIRRGMRGEKIWRPHRSHYYQRVVMLGASHRQLALAAYALMLAMTAIAFAMLLAPQYAGWLFIIPILTYLFVILSIDEHWQRSHNEP